MSSRRIPERRFLYMAVAVFVSAGLMSARPASGQVVPIGSWRGVLAVAGLEMVFHLERGEDGTLLGTMDVPAQGAEGVPLIGVSFDEGVLHLQIPGAPGGASYEGTWAEGEREIRGFFSQAGQRLELNLSHSDDAGAAPARPQTPEPPFPYEVVEVRYESPTAGIELAGTLTLPEGDGPFPAVLTVSGSGPQDRDETILGHRPFAVLADYLTRQGIAVLRVDDRGVGESGGDFATATTADFADDAEAGVTYLASRIEIDPARVGILGHSEGGIVAPMVAARSEEIAFAILLAGPSVPGAELMLEQGRRIALVDGQSQEAIEANAELQVRLFEIVREERDVDVARPELRRVLEAAIMKLTEAQRAQAGVTAETQERFIAGQVASVNTPWMRFFLDYDPGPTLEGVTVPVLALNGSLDLQVPADQNLPVIQRALEVAGNQDVTIEARAGLNHLLQRATTGSPAEYASITQTMDPSVLDLIAAWILERFGS